MRNGKPSLEATLLTALLFGLALGITAFAAATIYQGFGIASDRIAAVNAQAGH